MTIQILHVDLGHCLLLECVGKTSEVELGHPVAGDKLFSVTKKSALNTLGGKEWVENHWPRRTPGRRECL